MYTDLHNHCLPEVDDGADSMEESLQMLRISEKNGVHQIIATPHYHYRRGHAPAERIRQKVCDLNEEAAEQGIGVTVFPGNEICYCHDIVELLEAGKVLTMAESRYVLVEFSPEIPYESLRAGLYRVYAGGYQPILAHADRVNTLTDRPDRLAELCDMGICVQVNIGSVRSDSTRHVRKFVKNALEHGLVHFLATDAHHEDRRTPDMAEDIRCLKKKYGEGLLRELMAENPAKVIAVEMI